MKKKSYKRILEYVNEGEKILNNGDIDDFGVYYMMLG